MLTDFLNDFFFKSPLLYKNVQIVSSSSANLTIVHYIQNNSLNKIVKDFLIFFNADAFVWLSTKDIDFYFDKVTACHGRTLSFLSRSALDT